MVVLILGGGEPGKEQKFVVHRELLMLHSGFFRELLTQKVEEVDVKTEEIDTAMSEELSTMNAESKEGGMAIEQKGEGNAAREGPDGEGGEENGQEMSRESSLSSLRSSPFDPSSAPSSVENIPTTKPAVKLPQGAGTTTPALVELRILSLDPTSFAAFLAYIYTHDVPGNILALQPSQEHLFPTLYLFASQLGSAGFMNYILTQQLLIWKTGAQWPFPSQVSFIYSALSTFSTEGTMGMGAGILKTFTAACIAANDPYTCYEPGCSEYAEWDMVMDSCLKLRGDVMRQGSKWILRKPWDEVSRNIWMVQEKSLGERWEDMFINGEEKRALGDIEKGVEGGCVRSQLQYGFFNSG